MKVACLSVIYPGMAQYIEEYIECVRNQTTKAFDLILVDDKFPLALKKYTEQLDIDVKVFKHSKTPLENRLYGLKVCRDLGYDIVICSDSDDTMDRDRVKKVVEYFIHHPENKFVYNNSVGCYGKRVFDLYYKKKIIFSDIIDFNVLGYGSFNLVSDFIPFILSNANKNVLAHDWWFGMVCLLNYRDVDFLKDVKNSYRFHSGNFIGPCFNINEKGILFGIRVKKNLYSEMAKYCCKKEFKKEERLFKKKLREIFEIEEFISKFSLEWYMELVKSFFAHKKKLYWYRDTVSLDKLSKKSLAMIDVK